MSHLVVPVTEIYHEMRRGGPALVFAHGLGRNHLSWRPEVFDRSVADLLDAT